MRDWRDWWMVCEKVSNTRLDLLLGFLFLVFFNILLRDSLFEWAQLEGEVTYRPHSLLRFSFRIIFCLWV